MKRPILLTTAFLAAGIMLAGCTATAATGTTGAEQAATTSAASDSDLTPAAVLAENEDYTTVNVDEWSEDDAVDVTLSGDGISGSADGVTASDGIVTISDAGVYRLSGVLAGQVRVEAPEDALVVLILDGAEINNDAGAAIEVVSADDVAIHLADGSTNSVSDTDAYADDADANAAIYSDADLTISGSGALSVSGNGNDGITSKDDLVILDGTITVDAADDALRGKDSLVVEGGSLTLTATGGDGLKSDGDDGKDSADIDWTRGYVYVRGGTVDITSGDDGLQAFTDTVIASGSVTVDVADDGIKGEAIVAIGEIDGHDAPTVTVTQSEEGIEAANIGISAGTIDVTAADDGINASGNGELQALISGTEYVAGNREADSGERLEITGGTLTVRAGTDGLDSNGSITVSGGEVDITSADNGGDGPIDGNGTIDVADGIVTANGSAWDASTAQGMGGGPGGGPGGAGGPGGDGRPPQDDNGPVEDPDAP